MPTVVDVNTLTISMQEMRKSQSYGFIASIITRRRTTLNTRTMRVTGTYNEPLDRQLMERVKISNFKGPLLMNRRNEMGGLRVERMQYRRWEGDQ